MEEKSAYKYCCAIGLILSSLFFVAIANLPYGYYQFLRVFTLISIPIFSYFYYNAKNAGSLIDVITVALLIILILFNPILPVYLQKSTWVIIDAVCGIIMLINTAFIFLKYKTTSNVSSNTTSNVPFNTSSDEAAMRFHKENFESFWNAIVEEKKKTAKINDLSELFTETQINYIKFFAKSEGNIARMRNALIEDNISNAENMCVFDVIQKYESLYIVY